MSILEDIRAKRAKLSLFGRVRHRVWWWVDSVFSAVIGRNGPGERLGLRLLCEVSARRDELYEAMRIAEDVGVDEGLFDEEERMTERLEPPTTAAGISSCEEAAEYDEGPADESDSLLPFPLPYYQDEKGE